MEKAGSRASPDVTRRRFLKVLAVVSAGTTLGDMVSAERSEAAPADTQDQAASQPGHQWVMVFDLRTCDGCGKCTDACQKTHYLSKDQKWINVYNMTDSDGQSYFMPRPCMHCENAPCVRVCPVGATFRNQEGVVLVDQQKCIGCRTCMAACPYEARYFNWTQPPPAPSTLQNPMPEFPVPQQKGTVGKCILCVHNTEVGKLPACVDGCPMGAIYIGDLTTDIATNGQQTVKLSTFLRDNDAIRYQEQLGTRPRVWYIPGHGQLLNY